MPSTTKLAAVVTRSAVWVALSAFAAVSLANQAPVVNAGDDQPTVRINNTNVYLFGEATDDSTPVDNLTYLWAQVSGPASANIATPTENPSRITFPQTGTYVFELRVYDGSLIGRDSTVLTVLDSLPFMIFTPRDNAQILIGHPYVIRWQLDPMRMCEVKYSLDGGQTFQLITLDGSVRDSTVWDVDASFKDSTRQGIMMVHEYQHEVFYTTSTFILVDSLTAARPGVERAASSPDPRVFIDRDGVLRIAGARVDPSARITVFSANGATLLSSRLLNGAASLTSPVRGVLIYRIDAKTGRAVWRCVR